MELVVASIENILTEDLRYDLIIVLFYLGLLGFSLFYKITVNLSCETTLSATEKWSFKAGGL